MKVFTCSIRVKYVVCSPTKVVLYLIELIWSTLVDSLTVIPFSCGENFFKELDINNV